MSSFKRQRRGDDAGQLFRDYTHVARTAKLLRGDTNVARASDLVGGDREVATSFESVEIRPHGNAATSADLFPRRRRGAEHDRVVGHSHFDRVYEWYLGFVGGISVEGWLTE